MVVEEIFMTYRNGLLWALFRLIFLIYYDISVNHKRKMLSKMLSFLPFKM